jgi:hypothetical protein
MSKLQLEQQQMAPFGFFYPAAQMRQIKQRDMFSPAARAVTCHVGG